MSNNIHDQIISAWLNVLEPKNGEIRLFGRVNDPLIGNTSDKEVFLFIPDLHLISPQREKDFKEYRFNYPKSGLLAKLLEEMIRLKDRWEHQGDHELFTVQIGDFFDMWREFPGSNQSYNIPDGAHGELRDILYRGEDRGIPFLDATMILGNHDTANGIPLPEIDFQLKVFHPTEDNTNPFLFVTHGDAYDFIETTVPEDIRAFMVNLVGNLTPVHEYSIENWGKMAAKINKPMKDLKKAITEPEHSIEIRTGAPKVLPGNSLPPIFCEEITTPDQSKNKYFKKIYDSIGEAAKKRLPGGNIRVAAIGHTHVASMVFCKPENDERPLLLMDAGAWIERCKYFFEENGNVSDKPRTEPSAQLGVLHGNDARIYQIYIPEDA